MARNRRSSSARVAAAVASVVESLETRRLFAAHIVGSSTVYATIQAAVDAAAPGATINVDAGTYNETVVITKSGLTLRGAQAGVDARNARGAESTIYATQTCFDVNANDVTIDGFNITGNDANIGALQGAGVLMRPNIHGTHVLNDVVQNNVTGIYLSNNSNTDACLIQHCLIQNNFEAGNNWATTQWNGSRGIYTDGTVSGGYLTNVTIDSNHIANSNFNGGDEDEGIIALQALTAGKQFNITITNNYLGSESKALLATNVTNLVFMGNTATGFQDGSSGPVRFEGNANNVDIQYNSIYGNSGPGVAADSSGVAGDSSGFVVNYNNIYNNDGIGVLVIASVYDGPLVAVGDWWGSASGPGGLGPGTGQAVWANGNSGHGVTPTGAAGGGPVTFSPWATSLIDITKIPAPVAASALTVAPAAANQLTLNWTAPSSTATSQLVQRSTDGVNFTTIAVIPPLLNTFTDTGLTSGVTYTYRVVTSNGTGNGAASNAAAALSPEYQAPMPVNGITLAASTGTTNTLSWNLPTYAYGIASYAIYRNGVAVGSSTTPAYTDTGLTPGTAYTYSVVTVDTTGATSAPSAATTLLAAASQFRDPSFELTPASSSYAPATANWTFTGYSAIAASGGSFGTFTAPSGTQVALIQSNGSTVGAISQSVTVSPAGSYTISLSAAQRTGYTTEPITVKVDGTLVGTISPTSKTFATYTTAKFNLTAGTHTITFSGTTAFLVTAASFIDAVSLNLVPSVVPAAPVGLIAAAASATQVNLNWSPGGAGATGFTVLRSTDNVNWTTLASALPATTTAYADTTAAAAAKYYYAVVATNAIGKSANSTAAQVTTLSAAAVATNLSTLAWVSATSGYQTTQNNVSIAGNTLTLHGTTYASGLGTSAVSAVTYNLGGAYAAFTTDVGIDAEEYTAAGALASVDFQVLGDGKVLFDSGDLTINSPTVHIAVPVTGVQTLTLVATNGVAGIAYDHADWAGAKLLANPTAPTAPSNLAAVALGANAINLTWSATSTNQTSFAIDRSSDGTTWTTLTSGVSASATSWTDTSTLSPSTIYYYRVRAVNAAGASPNSAVASTTTLGSATVSTQLSSLNWTSATAGYGTVQKNASIKGNTLTLHGTTYNTGIGTHAASTITYNLAGNYNVFNSDVGIDDEEIGVGTGSVDFQVIGDGKVLYDTGVLTGASPTAHLAVSVAGVQTLQLVATNGVTGSIDYDHADWAGATLVANAAAPSAPTGLAAVALSSSSIKLSWTAPGNTQTSYAVDRSTDGVNFATVATGVAGTATTWTDATALAAGTTYYYRVRAANAIGTSTNSNVASTATLPVLTTTTYLSDLAWTSATAGWGTVQQDVSIKGNPLTLHGVTYAKGLGTHAASTITYNLAGKYSYFLSDVGLDDEELGLGSGSVDFQVIGDGKVLYDSGTLTAASPTANISLSVAGVQTLTLVVTNTIPNNIDFDHADWAGARLLA